MTKEPIVLEDYSKVEKTDRCVLLGWCPWKTTDKWPKPVSNRVFSQRGTAPTIPAQSNNTIPQVLIEYDGE
jgi:hypothetical protein